MASCAKNLAHSVDALQHNVLPFEVQPGGRKSALAVSAIYAAGTGLDLLVVPMANGHRDDEVLCRAAVQNAVVMMDLSEEMRQAARDAGLAAATEDDDKDDGGGDKGMIATISLATWKTLVNIGPRVRVEYVDEDGNRRDLYSPMKYLGSPRAPEDRYGFLAKVHQEGREPICVPGHCEACDVTIDAYKEYDDGRDWTCAVPRLPQPPSGYVLASAQSDVALSATAVTQRVRPRVVARARVVAAEKKTTDRPGRLDRQLATLPKKNKNKKKKQKKGKQKATKNAKGTHDTKDNTQDGKGAKDAKDTQVATKDKGVPEKTKRKVPRAKPKRRNRKKRPARTSSASPSASGSTSPAPPVSPVLADPKPGAATCPSPPRLARRSRAGKAPRPDHDVEDDVGAGARTKKQRKKSAARKGIARKNLGAAKYAVIAETVKRLQDIADSDSGSGFDDNYVESIEDASADSQPAIFGTRQAHNDDIEEASGSGDGGGGRHPLPRKAPRRELMLRVGITGKNAEAADATKSGVGVDLASLVAAKKKKRRAGDDGDARCPKRQKVSLVAGNAFVGNAFADSVDGGNGGDNDGSLTPSAFGTAGFGSPPVVRPGDLTVGALLSIEEPLPAPVWGVRDGGGGEDNGGEARAATPSTPQVADMLVRMSSEWTTL